MARNPGGIIKDIWAQGGDRSRFTEQGYTVTQGWSDEYSNPGGKNPEREIFNQILFQLYSFAKDVQSHGILEWSDSTEIGYSHPAIVSKDSKWYVTRKNVPANSPALSPSDPGNNEYWQEIFFSSSRSANDADKTNWNETDPTLISYLRNKPITVPLEVKDDKVTGTSNVIELAPVIVVKASTDTSGSPKLVEGLTIRFKAKNNSTGNVSINVSEIGAKNLNYAPINSSSLRVGSGGIKAGNIYTIYYTETSSGYFIILNESQGVQSTSRTGEVVAFAGLESTVPSNARLCKGQAYNGAENPYQDLYAKIGKKYGNGGNSSPTSKMFNVPNCQGRMILGSSSDSDSDLGQTGGRSTTSFTVELPRHNHGLRGHTHTVQDRYYQYTLSTGTQFFSRFSHGPNPSRAITSARLSQRRSDPIRTTSQVSGDTEFAGSSSSQSIDLMNPFIRLNYIIYI